jgi:hypothetical protein
MRATSMPATTSPLLLSALLIIAVLCAISSPANAGALYKWVDEDGRIRYSDRLPPAQAKKKHQQLNSQGMVLNTKEAARPEAEVAAEAAEKLKLQEEQAAAARLNEVQNKKDRVLLLTFSNENELSTVHNNRIEVVESVIQLINKGLVTTQQQLDELEISAKQFYLAQGLEIPGGLAQKIEHFSRKMEIRNSQLELKMLEKDKLNEQYEIDLARYRLLKNRS